MVILIGYPQSQLEYHMLNKLFGPKSLSRKRLWRRDYLWMRPGDVVSDEVSDDSKLLNPMEGNPFKFVICYRTYQILHRMWAWVDPGQSSILGVSDVALIHAHCD